MLAEAMVSAASVGLGCGAGCGSSAFAFLSGSILAEGKGLRAALRQALFFLLGKLLAVAALCAASSLLSRALLSLGGDSALLEKLLYAALLVSALWLLYGWVRERKGCKGCKHCHGAKKSLPAFAVGAAYGASPCAPLLMVLGYAALLSLPGALALGTVFALSSALVPSLLTLAVAGTLSGRIVGEMGKLLPWFQLFVYLLFLCAAIVGLWG